MDLPSLYLGAWRPLDGSANALPFRLPAHHLVTHGVITGMTGSGKTGLVTVMVDEGLRARVLRADFACDRVTGAGAGLQMAKERDRGGRVRHRRATVSRSRGRRAADRVVGSPG